MQAARFHFISAVGMSARASARRSLALLLAFVVPFVATAGVAVGLLGTQHHHDGSVVSAHAELVDFRRHILVEADHHPAGSAHGQAHDQGVAHEHSHATWERHHHDRSDSNAISLDSGESTSVGSAGSVASALVLAVVDEWRLPAIERRLLVRQGPTCMTVDRWEAAPGDRPPQA